jgi:hypothetical protein
MEFVVIAMITAAIGWAIGNRKGRGGAGLALGLLLGLIGIVIILCLKPKVSLLAPPMKGGAVWRADPYGSHQFRYWNGMAWTGHVSDGGVHTVDSLGTR